jgi:hypothetical protein
MPETDPAGKWVGRHHNAFPKCRVAAKAVIPPTTAKEAQKQDELRKSGQYSKATGQDRNSVLVDYDIFMNVRRLDAQDISSLQKLYKAEDFDFRLKPGSVAVDKGTVLPNVTEGFSGKAPDLGALEAGAAAPHYGPRP